MIHVHDQSRFQMVAGFVFTMLAMLLLSACGTGENGDESESSGETSLATVEDISSDETVEPSNGPPSPSSTDDPPAGSPDVSESPGVNVSSPPITLPTMAPTVPSAAATPAPDGSVTGPPNAGVAADVVVGDGTGGAVSIPDDAADDTEASVDSSPAASPASPVASVASCTVASYPAYSGVDAAQVTTVETSVRAGPGADCDLFGDPIPAGTQVEVLSEPVQREGESTWLAVSIDGAEGWLASDDLEAAGAGQ